MHESLPLRPIESAAPAAPARTASSENSAGAAAFKALLDELEQRAQALEVESGKDLSKDDLADAVDSARVSLEQMLSLKDQLLEAWRASQLEQIPPPLPDRR